MRDLLRNVIALYETYDDHTADKLPQLYHSHVHFQDPFHTVIGLHNLQNYFARLSVNLDHCRFEFDTIDECEGKVFLTWTMHLQTKKLKGGKEISVSGITELRFDDKIFYHRDYFDGGQMLYENIPLLGGVVRSIKRRL